MKRPLPCKLMRQIYIANLTEPDGRRKTTPSIFWYLYITFGFPCRLWIYIHWVWYLVFWVCSHVSFKIDFWPDCSNNHTQRLCCSGWWCYIVRSAKKLKNATNRAQLVTFDYGEQWLRFRGRLLASKRCEFDSSTMSPHCLRHICRPVQFLIFWRNILKWLMMNTHLVFSMSLLYWFSMFVFLIPVTVF